MKKCLRSLPEFQPNIFHQEKEEGEANQEEQKPQQAPRTLGLAGFHFDELEGSSRLINSVSGLPELWANKGWTVKQQYWF